MSQSLKEIILKELKKKGEIRVKELVNKTKYTQPYIFRFLQELRDEGKIQLVGKARNSKYITADRDTISKAKSSLLTFNTTVNNAGIDEHSVLERIKKDTGIFTNLPKNVSDIVDYSFTEMFNNAIEHSRSEKIEIKMKKESGTVRFDVIDRGIGIYNNIMQKFNLSNELEAIQDLIKGKLTTAKEAHTGEGIFFTSKAADNMIIQSSKKKLIFNNIIGDVFIKDVKNTIGTKVICTINLSSKRNLTEIFNQYTDESFEFSKTKVTVKLYKMGVEYVSRSQARRILTGLDKFKTIILDFKDVETIGQGFADEIFRVWKNGHPSIEITPINENENIRFMITRAIKTASGD